MTWQTRMLRGACAPLIITAFLLARTAGENARLCWLPARRVAEHAAPRSCSWLRHAPTSLFRSFSAALRHKRAAPAAAAAAVATSALHLLDGAAISLHHSPYLVRVLDNAAWQQHRERGRAERCLGLS